MFHIIRGFFLAVFITFITAYACYAQDVPITAEYDYGGLIPNLEERNTCDPDIMEVIDSQAWEAAQREITQNANIYVRPDSVLSLSCFNQFLNNQVRHADDNFPSDPSESTSKNLFGDFVTGLLVSMEKNANNGIPDPMTWSSLIKLTGGYSIGFGTLRLSIDKYALEQTSLLEILVLDQLRGVNSPIQVIEDALSLTGFAAAAFCGGRQRYIKDNFPAYMLGGRARKQKADPVYPEISSSINKKLSTRGSYACDMMNRVWQRAKCYDFATEDNAFYESGDAFTGGLDHDGFYMYYNDDKDEDGHKITDNDYVSLARSGKDYRRVPSMCDPPDDNYLGPLPSIREIACFDFYHGSLPGAVSLPAMPALIYQLYPSSSGIDMNYLITSGLTALSGIPDGSPEWDDQHSDANPVAGNPGAGDVYQSYIDLVEGSVNCLNNENLSYVTGACSGEMPVNCADPIRTGFEVIRKGAHYYDAVCPNPGCFFTAPKDLNGNGKCSR